MISPPSRSDLYLGRIPPVWQQWLRLRFGVRVALIGVPLAIVLILLVVSVRVGVTAAVLAVGVGGISAVFVKNRTDRHNAAIDRGEIRLPADPHLRPARADELPAGVLDGLARWGLGTGAGDVTGGLGRVLRFDEGWIVGSRNPRDVAVVAGDDGGWARFDPRRVPDLWAANEYVAGRGRDA